MAGWCRLCLRRWIRFWHRPYDGIPDERPYNDEDQRVHEIYLLMVLIMGISQASSNFIFPSLNLHYLTALWLLPESISEDFVVPIWLNLPVGAIAPVCPLA